MGSCFPLFLLHHLLLEEHLSRSLHYGSRFRVRYRKSKSHVLANEANRVDATGWLVRQQPVQDDGAVEAQKLHHEASHAV